MPSLNQVVISLYKGTLRSMRKFAPFTTFRSLQFLFSNRCEWSFYCAFVIVIYTDSCVWHCGIFKLRRCLCFIIVEMVLVWEVGAYVMLSQLDVLVWDALYGASFLCLRDCHLHKQSCTVRFIMKIQRLLSVCCLPVVAGAINSCYTCNKLVRQCIV